MNRPTPTLLLRLGHASVRGSEGLCNFSVSDGCDEARGVGSAMDLSARQRRAMDRFLERVQPFCPACGYGPAPPRDPLPGASLVERTYSLDTVQGAAGTAPVVVVSCGKCGHMSQFNQSTAIPDDGGT